MPLCLTYFDAGPEADVLANHVHYCRMRGYPHRWAGGGHVGAAPMRLAYKWAFVRRELAALAEGDWLLFLDQDSVVVLPLAIDDLLAGAQAFVADHPTQDGSSPPKMANMLILRNTVDNRARLDRLVAAVGAHLVLSDAPGEHGLFSAQFADIPPVSPQEVKALNISWRVIDWFRQPVFVAHLGPLPPRSDGTWYSESATHDTNLQRFLVARVNAALRDGTPILVPAAYPAGGETPYEVLNAPAPVALVTLFTPHIRSYAHVAEQNMRRYCLRHGYALHVYRDVPLPIAGMQGNWAKPWVLLQHLPHHQWVIWVDADILFVQQKKPLESILAPRDLLMGKDIGGWKMNSGVMGFRNTPANMALLQALWRRIQMVSDKSSVYASQGDQYYVNELLEEQGWFGPDAVSDFLTINTHSALAGTDSLMVHFMGLGEPYRSAYMAHWDTQSLQQG